MRPVANSDSLQLTGVENTCQLDGRPPNARNNLLKSSVSLVTLSACEGRRTAGGSLAAGFSPPTTDKPRIRKRRTNVRNNRQENTWQERLRSAGMRVTASRLAVLEAVGGEAQHLDAEAIAAAARARLGTLSTQAVYDNLHALVDAGLIRRIQPAGGPARYEKRTGDNHHHIVCRLCGATSDTDCVVGSAPCLEPTLSHGYLVDEAEVIFWGLCPDCQTSASQSPPED